MRTETAISALTAFSVGLLVTGGIMVDYYERSQYDLKSEIAEFEELHVKQSKELAQVNAEADKLQEELTWAIDNSKSQADQISNLSQKVTETEEQIETLKAETEVVNPEPLETTVRLFMSMPTEKNPDIGIKGSGTHIGNGLILTAGHVVDYKEGTKVKTSFRNGNETEATTLWASKEYDVAVLQMDDFHDAPASNIECRLPVLEERLTFEGNPGPLDFVVTHGKVMADLTDFAKTGPWEWVLPVDALINHGMSGGGTFDINGDLVGINVGIMPHQVSNVDSQNTGIGFIVPSSVFCNLLGRT